jgi:hypothetical protein
MLPGPNASPMSSSRHSQKDNANPKTRLRHGRGNLPNSFYETSVIDSPGKEDERPKFLTNTDAKILKRY